MAKALVETTGSFMLVDPQGMQSIPSHRPCVVKVTSFLQPQVLNDRVRVFGQLRDDATDEDFVEALHGSKNQSVAVEAFLAEFGIDALQDLADRVDADEKAKAEAEAAEKAKAEAEAAEKAKAEAEAAEAKAKAKAEAEAAEKAKGGKK